MMPNVQEFFLKGYPENINLFKLINRNTRKRCEVFSKLAIKVLELLTLNIFQTFLYFWYWWANKCLLIKIADYYSRMTFSLNIRVLDLIKC